ncbi:lipoyl synthase [Planctomycetota bacterium]
MRSGRIPASEFGKHMPDWLKKTICPGKSRHVKELLEKYELNTVCASAACPNRNECYSEGTATFMVLGNTCTRDCAFCNMASGEPEAPYSDEADRVAAAARDMELQYCVITSVTRDDLPDGGSGMFAACIRGVHDIAGCRVEVLTPDFQGREEDISAVIEAGPDVYNHNLETVESLYSLVRPQASYARSLRLLDQVNRAGLIAKSGIMVGVGETDEEIYRLFEDLLTVGGRLLTIGQYLRPNRHCLAVREYITPDHFSILKSKALEMGFAAVSAGPFVRSSHNARELFAEAEHAI